MSEFAVTVMDSEMWQHSEQLPENETCLGSFSRAYCRSTIAVQAFECSFPRAECGSVSAL